MQNPKKETRTAAPGHPRSVRLLQVLLVGLDHFLDHLAAHAARLTRGQVAVVALLQVDANLL